MSSFIPNLGRPVSNGVRHFSQDDLARSTGSFDSLHRLGSGAYADVYRGELNSGTRVAIKRFRGKKALDELKKEMSSLTSLQHPGVVSPMGFCDNPSCPAIVLEYLSGGSLSESQLTLLERLSALRQVACTLRYIHEAGFVHGDIKPANVVLTIPHGDLEAMILHQRQITRQSGLVEMDDSLLLPSAKLVDLGLARQYIEAASGASDSAAARRSSSTATTAAAAAAAAAAATSTASMTPLHVRMENTSPQNFGTLPYMAPELRVNKPKYSPATDVYSFGVTLLTALTVIHSRFRPQKKNDPPTGAPGLYHNTVRAKQNGLKGELIMTFYRHGLYVQGSDGISWRPSDLLEELNKMSSQGVEEASRIFDSKLIPDDLPESSRSRFLVTMAEALKLGLSCVHMAVGNRPSLGSIVEQLGKQINDLEQEIIPVAIVTSASLVTNTSPSPSSATATTITSTTTTTCIAPQQATTPWTAAADTHSVDCTDPRILELH
jgi:serine/threonine protein kinase